LPCFVDHPHQANSIADRANAHLAFKRSASGAGSAPVQVRALIVEKGNCETAVAALPRLPSIELARGQGWPRPESKCNISREIRGS
jgi:hypothetical protein